MKLQGWGSVCSGKIRNEYSCEQQITPGLVYMLNWVNRMWIDVCRPCGEMRTGTGRVQLGDGRRTDGRQCGGGGAPWVIMRMTENRQVSSTSTDVFSQVDRPRKDDEDVKETIIFFFFLPEMWKECVGWCQCVYFTHWLSFWDIFSLQESEILQLDITVL